MKKLDVKSIIVGLVIGIIGVSIVFVALGERTAAISKKEAVAEAKEKKSSTMNGQNNQENTEITPNIPENKTNTEAIETTKRIQKGMEITTDDSNNEIDAEAIETINKTGNWGYIEKYIPHMTANGIEKVVEIYNSKHSDSSEHKKATDYIKN